MNKQNLLTKIIKHLKENCKQMEQSALDAAKGATEQEGPMQSRYDTMRAECSFMADKLNDRVQQIYAELEKARSYSLPEKTEIIQEGSIAEVLLPSLKKMCYFILSFAGGFMTEFEDKSIAVVTLEAPISNHLLGKKRGDTFKVPQGKYKIIAIY